MFLLFLMMLWSFHLLVLATSEERNDLNVVLLDKQHAFTNEFHANDCKGSE